MNAQVTPEKNRISKPSNRLEMRFFSVCAGMKDPSSADTMPGFN